MTFSPRLLLLLSTLSSGAAEPPPGTLFYHISWPEASAVSVVGSPPRWLAVADNETPFIGLFALEPPATDPRAPAGRIATSPSYPVDDLEACTVFPFDANGEGKPEKVYHVYAASGSRSKKGKVVSARDLLFALHIDEAAITGPTKNGIFPPVNAVKFNRTMRSQVQALGSAHADEPWGPILRDSISAPGQDAAVINLQLAGGTRDGFNVEGLTVSSDGRSLLLGLRSPLVEGKAVLVPITNPAAALGLSGAVQPLALAEPSLLDLGGLGFRSIEWDAQHRVYLISAGSPDDGGVFRFYTWTGNAADAPVAVTTPSAVAAARLDPEGLTPIPGMKSAVIVGDGEAKAPVHKGMWVDFGTGK
ncbi:MAG TPA: DUF3616 domain-containing protein [Verrucomicrobiales bacterium]|nr:DUF3616 domain-containing protein [Verrucomicrobiales bacterium]